MTKASMPISIVRRGTKIAFGCADEFRSTELESGGDS